MENYEVKGVSNASEIKKAYTEAVADNYKYYRAVSKTNQIYGWNENTNNFVKAQAGQEWFENPRYVAPSVEEPIEEKADILEEVVEVANEMVEEVKAEEVIVEKATTEEIDYKALYEQAQGTIKELESKVASLEKEIEEKDIDIENLQEELEDIRDAGKVLKKIFG